MSEGVENRRAAKVEKIFRETIANLLISDYRGELKGFVSVSHVRVSSDFRYAKVYISIIGSAEDAKFDIDFLNDEAGAIQGVVGRQVKMKFCPRVSFIIDNTAEEMMRIQKLIEDTKRNDR